MTETKTVQHQARAARKASIIATTVRMPINGHTFHAVCTNISDLGMRLRFSDARYFHVGHQIDIEMPVFGFVTALICWVTAPRIGVKFLTAIPGAAQLPWTPQPRAEFAFHVPAHLAGMPSRDIAEGDIPEAMLGA